MFFRAILSLTAAVLALWGLYFSFITFSLGNGDPKSDHYYPVLIVAALGCFGGIFLSVRTLSADGQGKLSGGARSFLLTVYGAVLMVLLWHFIP